MRNLPSAFSLRVILDFSQSSKVANSIAFVSLSRSFARISIYYLKTFIKGTQEHLCCPYLWISSPKHLLFDHLRGGLKQGGKGVSNSLKWLFGRVWKRQYRGCVFIKASITRPVTSLKHHTPCSLSD